MDSLLSWHNKAQCIFQGLVTSVYSQPRLNSRVLRSHRAGEGGCQDLTALAFLLLSVGSWSDLGLPGSPWDQTHSPVSDLCHVPGVRAAGPEVGAHVVVAALCRSSGGKIVTC